MHKTTILKYTLVIYCLLNSNYFLAQKKSTYSFVINSTLPVAIKNASFKSDDLTTKFFKNYNAYNVNLLKKGFDPLKAMVSPQFGFLYMGRYVCVESTFQKFKAESTAEFLTGETRHFEVSSRGVDAKLGIGYQSKYFAIFATIGTQPWGKPKVKSYMQYPDGTISMSDENLLNGYYEANGSIVPGKQLGLRIAAGAKNVKFYCSIEKFFRKVQSNNLGSGLIDGNKLITNEQSNSGSYMIGVDWDTYVQDPAQYILDSREVLCAEGWNMVQVKMGIIVGISTF